MVDPANIASNLRARRGVKRRRKPPGKSGVRFGIPPGETVVKIGSLPPGLAKKAAGAKSARAFAPGQLRKRGMPAGPNPNTGKGRAMALPGMTQRRQDRNLATQTARYRAIGAAGSTKGYAPPASPARPGKAEAAQKIAAIRPRPQAAAASPGGGRRPFPPPPGQAKKLAGAQSAKMFTRKRR